MAINLTNLAANKATKTVHFGGESMDVVYRPALITQERIEAVTGDNAVVDFLLDVLVSWDIRQGTKKMPLNKASITKLPFELVGVIFNQLVTAGGDVDPEA